MVMFGNLGAFVNGSMFVRFFGAGIGVKLPDARRAQFLALPGAGPFGPEERPMGGYVALPSAWTATKAPGVDRTLAAAAAQPPRAPKKMAAKRCAAR